MDVLVSSRSTAPPTDLVTHSTDVSPGGHEARTDRKSTDSHSYERYKPPARRILDQAVARRTHKELTSCVRNSSMSTTKLAMQALEEPKRHSTPESSEVLTSSSSTAKPVLTAHKPGSDAPTRGTSTSVRCTYEESTSRAHELSITKATERVREKAQRPSTSELPEVLAPSLSTATPVSTFKSSLNVSTSSHPASNTRHMHDEPTSRMRDTMAEVPDPTRTSTWPSSTTATGSEQRCSPTVVSSTAHNSKARAPCTYKGTTSRVREASTEAVQAGHRESTSTPSLVDLRERRHSRGPSTSVHKPEWPKPVSMASAPDDVFSVQTIDTSSPGNHWEPDDFAEEHTHCPRVLREDSARLETTHAVSTVLPPVNKGQASSRTVRWETVERGEGSGTKIRDHLSGMSTSTSNRDVLGSEMLCVDSSGWPADEARRVECTSFLADRLNVDLARAADVMGVHDWNLWAFFKVRALSCGYALECMSPRTELYARAARRAWDNFHRTVEVRPASIAYAPMWAELVPLGTIQTWAYARLWGDKVARTQIVVHHQPQPTRASWWDDDDYVSDISSGH
ncbi:uncharacterized protein B0H18DRAFT_960966 [Fomitopsis serialis]|uniref:uncharacterized protein n=1 Tax=Fomitopsis serialis TaxID=139415 RepID=UPI002007D78B|nr:uncharacterized protein B0H18DRAFT_960966 [Neoantrodia serialis]KAH9912540.1 hypothetical protein B0H18DRAFT_960966 [Neoantrodia serialis]